MNDLVDVGMSIPMLKAVVAMITRKLHFSCEMFGMIADFLSFVKLVLILISIDISSNLEIQEDVLSFFPNSSQHVNNLSNPCSCKKHRIDYAFFTDI